MPFLLLELDAVSAQRPQVFVDKTSPRERSEDCEKCPRFADTLSLEFSDIGQRERRSRPLSLVGLADKTVARNCSTAQIHCRSVDTVARDGPTTRSDSSRP